MQAVFLDRDGVICQNRSDYIKSWSEFRFLPGAKESLAALSRLEVPIIVVTNQSVIGRNIVPAGVVDDIHHRMAAEIRACGGRIDRVLYCPHHPDQRCNCRKPEPGMLLQAAQELDIDLPRSYMIGDAATDLIAGQRVGCRAFLVLTGRGARQLWPALRVMRGRFTITRNLMGAVNHILELEAASLNHV